MARVRWLLCMSIGAGAVTLVSRQLGITPVAVACMMMALFMVTMSGRYAPAMTMITNAVDARYRGFGLYPLLLAEWHRQLQGTPYQRAEFSWVLEDNSDINHAAEAASAQRYKTYRLYEKALGGGASRSPAPRASSAGTSPTPC